MTNNAIVPTTSRNPVGVYRRFHNSEVAMMIGVGVVKDSDAVFFQYVGGEEMPPQALTMPSSGRPLTRLANVRLDGHFNR